ncbi:MAG: serine/threonine protein kinase [Leptolyngbyaceae cyanobacterium RM1_406_9]|nr:serine/threonine protein kinase [Leptolyngbyaceae cyanobacterium RM1_406_9]
MNLAAGAVLQSGKYVVHSVLGQGDDLIYQATHSGLDQTVLLQTLREEPDRDLTQRQQQFLMTAKQLAQCSHPHLARLLDVFQEDTIPFAVLEYVSGQTLADRVQSSHPFAEAVAVQYIRQIASALQALHRQGLVHQRVKPQNIVLKRGTGEVVLTGVQIADQGRSPFTQFPSLKNSESSTSIEAAPAFLPPPDPSTDIQALTITLYYLLTGQHPATRTIDFVSLNQTALDQSSLIALRQLHPQLSPGVEQAILKGLQPAHLRPQSISEWLDILDNLHPNPLILEPFEPIDSFSSLPKSVQTNGHSLETSLSDEAEDSSGSDRPPTTEPLLPQFDDLAAGLTRVSTVVPRPILPEPPQPVHKPVRWLPIALVMTSAIAAIGGAGFGLALRLNTPGDTSNGTTGFGRDQTFPPIEDWPGADTYDFESEVDIPVERRPSASGDSTDYGIENFTPEYDPDYEPEYDLEYDPGLESEPLPLEEEPTLTESEPPLKVEPLPNVESLEPLDIAPLPTEPSTSPDSNLYPSLDPNRNPNVRSVAPTPLPDPAPL